MVYQWNILCFFAVLCLATAGPVADDVDTYLDKICKEYYEESNVVSDYSHAVQLGYVDKNKTTYNCAGSLISKNLVLTSAICLTSSLGPPKFVLLGTTNFEKNPSQVQKIDIDSFVVYPDYVPTTKRNDLGVIVLRKNVEFNERTRPICFQSTVDESKSTLIGTGWGILPETTHSTDEMKVIEVERFANEKCTKQYDNYLSQMNYTTEFCAVTKTLEMDLGIGDTGAPVQINHPKYEKAHLQVGITSSGKGIYGSSEIPSIYLYVPPYVGWIKEMIIEKAT